MEFYAYYVLFSSKCFCHELKKSTYSAKLVRSQCKLCFMFIGLFKIQNLSRTVVFIWVWKSDLQRSKLNLSLQGMTITGCEREFKLIHRSAKNGDQCTKVLTSGWFYLDFIFKYFRASTAAVLTFLDSHIEGLQINMKKK